MSKLLFFTLILFAFTSCVVSKKKYLALEQELTQIKADLKDDDNDGVPNYIDLEPKTEALAEVDKQGRTVIVETIVDIDEDGVLDVDDFCPTIKGVAAANGCPDRDGDGVYDFEDKCPKALGLKKDGGCPVVVKDESDRFKNSDGSKILFKEKTLVFNEFTEEIIDNQINAIVKILKDSLTYTVVISGHTDIEGDSLKNIKLSEKRSNKIKDLLVKKGIKKNRIKTIGVGANQPFIVDPLSEKAKIYNNRVEIVLRAKEQ